MKENKITDSIIYIGVDDKEMDLFENQYITPNGVSYNSYVILDDKIAILDTVDDRKTDEWFKKLEEVLKEKEPNYLIVSHMEPDHSANIEKLANTFPTGPKISSPPKPIIDTRIHKRPVSSNPCTLSFSSSSFLFFFLDIKSPLAYKLIIPKYTHK